MSAGDRVTRDRGVCDSRRPGSCWTRAFPTRASELPLLLSIFETAPTMAELISACAEMYSPRCLTWELCIHSGSDTGTQSGLTAGKH